MTLTMETFPPIPKMTFVHIHCCCQDAYSWWKYKNEFLDGGGQNL